MNCPESFTCFLSSITSADVFSSPDSIWKHLVELCAIKMGNQTRRDETRRNLTRRLEKKFWFSVVPPTSHPRTELSLFFSWKIGRCWVEFEKTMNFFPRIFLRPHKMCFLSRNSMKSFWRRFYVRKHSLILEKSERYLKHLIFPEVCRCLSASFSGRRTRPAGARGHNARLPNSFQKSGFFSKRLLPKGFACSTTKVLQNTI